MGRLLLIAGALIAVSATVIKRRAKASGPPASRASIAPPRAAARADGSGSSARSGPTRDELYAEARRRGIKGRSAMTKTQLERALAGSGGTAS